MIIFAYGADIYTTMSEKKAKKERGEADSDDEKKELIQFSSYEIYKELISEKKGTAKLDKDSIEKRE